MSKKKKTKNQLYHLKTGTLILVGGVIPGVVVKRLDQFMYEILAEGKIHKVHRDVIIEDDGEDNE